jgi:hypothetical protein
MGNYQVRFLGEGAAARPLPYPASQHAAASATDACHRPGAARFIAGPARTWTWTRRRWLRCRADRRRGRPGHVEHEKKTFFSSLQNSRSEDGAQGRAALQRVHRSEAQTLDGHRSGGYTRVSAPRRQFRLDPLFSTRLRAVTQGYRAATAMQHFFLLAADFTHVDAAGTRKRPFFASAGCRFLIPQAFPHSYRTVSLQQPAGGDMSHPTSAAKQHTLVARRTTAPGAGRRRKQAAPKDGLPHCKEGLPPAMGLR